MLSIARSHFYHPCIGPCLQIQVAQEDISFQTAPDGDAAECIGRLGGLTIDQLRWMFSNLPVGELDHSGWQVESVPFEDGDDSTHLWSELHENCTATEIVLAGPLVGSNAYDFFQDHVLTAADEKPREYESKQDIREIAAFLQENKGAMSFFQLYDLLTVEYATLVGTIAPVPVMNPRGDYIAPNALTYESEEYPLLRNVYLGVSEQALENTRPFLEFGLSDGGTQALKDAGFWAIQEYKKLAMFTRLQSKLGMEALDITEHCGPPGELAIAGSVIVEPVSHTWGEIFNLGCPVDIDLGVGGSAAAAGRLCADLSRGKPVDIGNMSRDWAAHEGLSRGGEQDFVFDCLQGFTRRSAIRVNVAVDGIAILMPLNGPGHKCVDLLGGLTKDQLRWIYSSYDESKLIETGWDPSSLKNGDGNPKTHLWRELDARCEAIEIDLNGGSADSGAFAAFAEVILTDHRNGETIAQDRPHEYFSGEGEEVLLELLKRKGSIGFMGYHYYFNNKALFWVAPIENDNGTYVSPSSKSIGDGSYPMIRELYMNLLNDAQSLEQTVRLLEFGFYHPELIEGSGYVPLQDELRDEMLTRIYAAPYAEDELQDEDDDQNLSLGVVAGVVAGIFVLAVVGIYVCVRLYMPDKQLK